VPQRGIRHRLLDRRQRHFGVDAGKADKHATTMTIAAIRMTLGRDMITLPLASAARLLPTRDPVYSPGAMTRPRLSPDVRTDRSIVLVGLMGVGKTTVGRRLAARLGLPFVDADHEIETAAGMTINEIFERFGEPHFRDGERRVIARLINGDRASSRSAAARSCIPTPVP